MRHKLADWLEQLAEHIRPTPTGQPSAYLITLEQRKSIDLERCSMDDSHQRAEWHRRANIHNL